MLVSECTNFTWLTANHHKVPNLIELVTLKLLTASKGVEGQSCIDEWFFLGAHMHMISRLRLQKCTTIEIATPLELLL